MWRMPHRRIIHFEGANTRGMQPRRNAKRWSFVLYIVGKQVISELEDRTSNHICGWHPKEVGGTDCTIISGNKKLVRTNRAPKQLTTSMAKGIEQWRVQNIQTIKPILSDRFQRNVRWRLVFLAEKLFLSGTNDPPRSRM